MDAEAQNPVIIPFTRGFDSKSDPKTAQAPFLTVLENGVMRKISTLSPRYGFKPLELANPPTRATGAAAYDNELLVFDDTVLRTASTSAEAWVSRSSANAVATGIQTIVKNNSAQLSADWAVNQNIAVFCWREATGLYIATQDLATGAYFLTRTQVGDSSCTTPRAIAAGGNLFVGYGDGHGNFKVIFIGIGTPASYVSKTMATTMNTNGVFDWVLAENTYLTGISYIAFCMAASATNTMVLGSFDFAGFLGFGTNAPASITLNTAATATVIGMACQSANSLQAIAIMSLSGGVGALEFNTVNFAFGLIGANPTFTVNDPNGKNCAHIVGAFDPNNDPSGDNPQIVRFFYDVPSYQGSGGGLSPPNNLYGGYIERIDLDYATFPSPVFTMTPVTTNQQIASKPFAYGTNLYLVSVYPSYQQATNFVIGYDGTILSSHLFGQAVVAGTTVVGAPAQTTTGLFSWPILRQANEQSVNGYLFTINGIALSSVNFAAQGRYGTARMGEEIHVAGGLLQSYDGANLVEHSYLLAPDRIYSHTTASTGGNMSDGTYLYQQIYKWPDKRGQIHRSATSIPYTVTISGGTATQKVVLNVLPLVLTHKTDVVIEIYRTTNVGQVPFNVTNGALFNEPFTTGLLSFDDITSDADIQNNEILYTVGGELDNDPPPAASLIAAGKQRLFLAGCENPYAYYYSKKQITGVGMQFSLAFYGETSSNYGPISAIAVMDDKFVLWTHTAILYVSGDGPDPTGNNNSFTLPTLVASDVGCTNPASIVLGAEGLYFMSGKGLYLLSRSLQVSYVGAPVEEYNALAISSALILPDTNQIRFGSSDGPSTGRALVYNYFFQEPFSDQVQAGQWSTFTNYQHVAACVWQGQYTFVLADGTVNVEKTDYYADNLHPIQMRIRTSWFTGAILGFSLIPEIAVLGNYLSTHILLVNLYHDYQSFISDQLQFDTRLGLDVTTWGDASFWGQSPTFGGNGDNTYQFKSRIPQQLCEALQLEFINVIPAGVAPGPCYELNALALIMDMQKGLARMSPSHVI